MKKVKKLSVLLLMCFLISMVSMPVSASAAKLNKKSLSLNVGKSYILKISGTKGKITWTSSKKRVATVSSKGVVKAKKKGTATITAKYGKRKLTCKVTVKQPVTSVKLNKNSASIAVGKSVTLKATVAPTAANNKAVTWKSSNTSVAIVSSNGVVTGRKSGTATITATAKDGSKKKASCKVTVKGVTPATTPNKPTDNSTVIMTSKQLFDVLDSGAVGKTYTLGKDIDLSGYSKSAFQFAGTLDGKGHKLLNLKRRLVDINSGTIRNIIFDSCNIEGKHADACAVAGINTGSISDCIIKGKISVSEGGRVAAIAMFNPGTIENCNNYATIIGEGKYYDALGNEKSGSATAAGICIDNDGIITKCVNYGFIKGDESYASGIACYSGEKIDNCLNAGEVNGGCGLVSSVSDNGIIQNCVNVGKSSYGIAESVSGNIVDCYYLNSSSALGAPESQNVRMKAVESNRLLNMSAYPTLDFSKDWKMGAQYPIPRQQ